MAFFKRTAILALLFFLLPPALSHAGVMELSVGFNYSRTNYSAGNYAFSRRYGGSVAYHFWEQSSIEWSYQLVTDRTLINGLQDTTFNDQIYSINWVQSLASREAMLQPYLKGGVGQLNRDATGTYAGGAKPPALLDAVSGVLGAGLRITITRGFGIRFEATSYLQQFDIDKWKDNIGFTAGTSFYF